MARSSSPWRALRPVLLAGAAAATWLTLSSTPATADTGPDSSSPLGAPTSSVSSVGQDLAARVSPIPAGTVSGVSAPLVEVADTLAAGVARELTAPAAEALPVLEPVLQPVSDLLNGAVSLPAPPLDGVQVDVPGVLAPAPAG